MDIEQGNGVIFRQADKDRVAICTKTMKDSGISYTITFLDSTAGTKGMAVSRRLVLYLADSLLFIMHRKTADMMYK